jgi:hypothetical protein
METRKCNQHFFQSLYPSELPWLLARHGQYCQVDPRKADE